MVREAELFYESTDIVGEGPVWDSKTFSLFWIDILGKKLHRLNCKTNEKDVYDLPEYIGCFAIGEDDFLYLMLEKGLYKFNTTNEEFTFIGKPDDHLSTHRFNDGKCDPKGRFFVASMSNDLNEGGGELVPTSSMYYIDDNFKFHKVLDKCFVIPNGLAWSKDSKKFYHIDSVTKDVKEYDYDIETGEVTNGKTIIVFKEKDGVPDGMTIDNEGMLWIAHWDGAKLSRWNPHTKERLEDIDFPCKNVTSCVFGGENFDELYVTTASIGSENDPEQMHAGSIFRIKLDVKGQELFRFKIKK